MREMKDSGIEWAGEIPNEWKTIRTLYTLTMPLTDGPHTTPELYDDGVPFVSAEAVSCGKGKIDFSHIRGYVSEEFYLECCKKYIPQMYDIYMIKSGATTGTVSIVDTDTKFTIWSPLAVFRCNESVIIHQFLFYSLQADYYLKQVETQWSYGTQQNIGMRTLEKLYLILPPLPEQQKITAYLDRKCTEIDSLVSDIQHQIEVLEEYKRSVITEAVTKGLNPDVEMWDSGIAWIGDIPKHWITEKVKFHLERKEPRNPGNKQVLSVYREYGVIPKDSRDDNHNVTSEDTSNYKYVVPNHLVINKMKAWQGSMGISNYEGIVSPAYFIYRFTDEAIIPKYLHYLFRNCYKEEFRRISGGIREGQWDLSPTEFANTLLLIPPKDEQKLIIDHINSKVLEIDSIISEKKQQIETIEEYKKSLIFEYVTGKKEVQV